MGCSKMSFKDNVKKKLGFKDLTGKDEDNIPLDEGVPSIDSDGNDIISLMAISELVNMGKLKTVSRLKIEQIPNITKLYLFSQVFDTDYTKMLADNILQLQISIKGLGRRELVSLVQQRDNPSQEVVKLSSKDIFR